MFKYYALCGVFFWIFSYFLTRFIFGVESGNNFSELGQAVYFSYIMTLVPLSCICVGFHGKYKKAENAISEINNDSLAISEELKDVKQELKSSKGMVDALLNKRAVD